MPVSRKRKKKSTTRGGPPKRSAGMVASGDPADAILASLARSQQALRDRRAGVARGAAEQIIDALVTTAAERSPDELEDDLCVRFGAAMSTFDDDTLDNRANPEDLVEALLLTVDDRLHAATDAGAVGRVLAVIAGVLPPPFREPAARMAAAHLNDKASRRIANGRTPTGPVRWAHDAYHCRWAVVAPFTAAGGAAAGADRWYLWDVDTCAYEALTVYGGFHPSSDAALAAWRAAVGPAADTATLSTVDDREAFAALMPGGMTGPRLGGEDKEQYAEFLRARRLGGIVRASVDRVRGTRQARLTAEDARKRFAERLRALGHPDGPVDPDGDGPLTASELAAEMAESWYPSEAPLYPYCSPHKVAGFVPHLRDYYDDTVAPQLIEVLPEWIRLLAEHTGQPAELTERCLAYASGELPFPGLLDGRGEVNPMARVAE